MTPPYRTSLGEQKRRYASMLLGRRLRAHRGPPSASRRPIPDNSVPFIANPRSLADAEAIIARVAEAVAWARSLRS